MTDSILDDEDVTSSPVNHLKLNSSNIDDEERQLLVSSHALRQPQIQQQQQQQRISSSRLLVSCCTITLLAVFAIVALSFFPVDDNSTSNLCQGDLTYSSCIAPCGLTCETVIDADCSHPCWPGCACSTDKPYISNNNTCVASLDLCPKPTLYPTFIPASHPISPVPIHSHSPTALKPYQISNKADFVDFSSCSNRLPPTLTKDFLVSPSVHMDLLLARVALTPCKDHENEVSVFFGFASSHPCDGPLLPLKTWYSSNKNSEQWISSSNRIACHPLAARSFIHIVISRLSNLVPGAKYSYEFGVERTMTMQNRTANHHEFVAPPLPGESIPELNEGFVLGDTGFRGSNNGFKAMYQYNENVGLLIHVGDQTYVTNTGACWGGNQFGEPNLACGWNCTGKACTYASRSGDFGGFLGWTSLVDKTFGGRIAWMTTMGNHDNDPGWFFSNRPPIQAALPGVSPDQFPGIMDGMKSFQNLIGANLMDKVANHLREPLFYSFDYGMVHVVSYGTEDNPNNGYERWDGQPLSPLMLERFHKHFGVESAQYRWLVEDLKKANDPERRKKVPWIFAMTHRPMYHTAKHHPNCGGGGDWSICMVRDLYEPLLQRFKVNVLFAGHSHHYQRSLPIYRNKVNKTGTIHIVVGTGGFELLGEHWGKADWIAKRQSSWFGFGHYRIANRTHMEWKHIGFDNKTVIDSAWIVRED